MGALVEQEECGLDFGQGLQSAGLSTYICSICPEWPWANSSNFQDGLNAIDFQWDVLLNLGNGSWADGWFRSLYLLYVCAFNSNPETVQVCSGLCAIQGIDFFSLYACKVLRMTGFPLGPVSFTVHIKVGSMEASVFRSWKQKLIFSQPAGGFQCLYLRVSNLRRVKVTWVRVDSQDFC